MLLSANFSLLIFCLDDLSIDVSRVLKSHIIIVLLSISPFMSVPICFIYLFIYYKFIYFWLRWVFVAARGLSLVVASRGYSWLQCVGFSLWWLLLLWSIVSRHAGSVFVAHGL